MEIPFGPLIIPFLGGYIFLRFFNYTKIQTLRADKERIVIRASIVGFLSLSCAWTLHRFLELFFGNGGPAGLFASWKALMPIDFIGLSVTAFCISCLAPWPLNRLYSWERAINHAIREDAEPFELLLHKCKGEGRALALTLLNEKVYIGLVSHPFNPATPTNSISIIPMHSGFRDPVTKKMTLTMDYAGLIEANFQRLVELESELNRVRTELPPENPYNLPPDIVDTDMAKIATLEDEWEMIKGRMNLFQLVIPTSQIGSAFIFDEGIYTEHFADVSREKVKFHLIQSNQGS